MSLIISLIEWECRWFKDAFHTKTTEYFWAFPSKLCWTCSSQVSRWAPLIMCVWEEAGASGVEWAMGQHLSPISDKLGWPKVKGPVQPCAGHPGHQLHILNHTVELIQFIWPGSRYESHYVLINRVRRWSHTWMLWKWAARSADSTVGVMLWRREGGRGVGIGGFLFKDVGAKFD